MPSDHIYTAEGDVFTPTTWAGSPWSETAQHGGPPNALFMRAVERLGAEAGMRPGRLTVDILKPIPMAPLKLSAAFLRRGRRLAVIDAELSRADDGALIATARAVVLKAHDDQPAVFAPPPVNRPGPEDADPCHLVSAQRRENGPPGFHLAITMRHGGAPDDPVTWFTWPFDLLPGQPPSPYQRCAAICDLTTVASGRVAKSPPGAWDNERHFNLLNTDTTVHFFRAPVGEWFGFSDSAITDHQGIGMSGVMLHDARGLVGRAVQTVASNA